MKQLLIVRHAKSSWNFPELDDFDRPLKKKGEKRTHAIGNYLKEKNCAPDLIKSSSAKRAADTTKILGSILNVNDSDIHITNNLYACTVDNILEEISVTDNSIEKLMLVGHNPVLTELANKLVGFDHIEWIVTSGLVIINYDTNNWKEINNAPGKLSEYKTPKELLSPN